MHIQLSAALFRLGALQQKKTTRHIFFRGWLVGI